MDWMARFVALKMARLKTGEIRAHVDVFESKYIVYRRISILSNTGDCLQFANNIARRFDIKEPVLALGPM